MTSQRIFALWQPAYAARGIATFPVEVVTIGSDLIKKPMIRGYYSVGLRGSRVLAEKFADATLFGFMCGPRSKITVLDVDTTDERMLTDALDRHGRTPVLVRTASGKYHAHYRHNGERRRIRPFPGLPIDILGSGGFVIAPPSATAHGHYEFIGGSLDDLDHLPVMLQPQRPSDLSAAAGPPDDDSSASASPLRGMRDHDGRNRALFLAIAPAARVMFAAGKSRDALFELAMSHNREASEPMAVDELSKIVDSVWRMTSEGRNWVGERGRRQHELSTFTDAADAFLLLEYLRVNEGVSAQFWIANGLADKFGWDRRRFTDARQRLVELGYVQQISKPWHGHPAVFVWPGWTPPF
jgi:hypothetical protein